MSGVSLEAQLLDDLHTFALEWRAWETEPTFCCGKCGCVGEFFHHYELCEDCVKVVYLDAQASTLRAWMAEYPNDKYTGAWWLAEFDRITGKAGVR
jgi:hypothetical protein